jgi:hypothetical protein
MNTTGNVDINSFSDSTLLETSTLMTLCEDPAQHGWYCLWYPGYCLCEWRSFDEAA